MTTVGKPDRALGWGLIALGAGLMVNSVLGPLLLEIIRYRFSESLLNQAIGLDAVSLGVIGPLAVAAGLLTLRAHPYASVLALGPAFFVTYMLVQYIVGPEYLRYDGNNERFFPFHLALFILGAGLGIVAWRATDAALLPRASRSTARRVGWVLIVSAFFLVFGLHQAGLADAMSGSPNERAYLDAPTSFWVVKFMDLGLVVPVALATGVGVLRRAAWATKAMYAALGWLSLMAAAVTAMAVTMQANGDPDASPVLTLGFGAITAALAWLTVHLYLPLFGTGPGGGTGRDSYRTTTRL
jgi:hypothetical protein